MIVIEDLLSPDERLRRFAAQPEMDPLTEGDALQEAQLLDVRFDALNATVGVLFELRSALQLREANTGLLVARGVRELSWTAKPRSTSRTAWSVMGSSPDTSGRLFGLTLGMWPDSHVWGFGPRARLSSSAMFPVLTRYLTITAKMRRRFALT